MPCRKGSGSGRAFIGDADRLASDLLRHHHLIAALRGSILFVGLSAIISQPAWEFGDKKCVVAFNPMPSNCVRELKVAARALAAGEEFNATVGEIICTGAWESSENGSEPQGVHSGDRRVHVAVSCSSEN